MKRTLLVSIAPLFIASQSMAQGAAGDAVRPVEGLTPVNGLTLDTGAPPSKVELAVAPYVWLTSFSGELSVRGADFDATTTFIDILDKSDRVFGLMGAVDVKYEKLVFQMNGAWTTAEVSESRGLTPSGVLRGDLDLDTVWFEMYAGYRILENPVSADAASRRRLTVDAFVGGRVTYVDLDAALTSDLQVTLPDGEILAAGQTRERGNTQEWFEPFVGARIGLDLSENWAINLRGDVGGFGLSGADFAWQVAAMLGYQWRLEGWTVAVFGGYRALGQDYSDGDFGWDLITHGPLLGTKFLFSF